MKRTDKLLAGIVAGIVLLVGVAFVAAFLRPEAAYRPDTTPEAAAHNYLLALQKGDYARAYSYLSPTLAGYPADAEAFAADVRENDYASHSFGDTSPTLAVESAHVRGERAEVKVRETNFYRGGLFGSGEYTNVFTMRLGRRNGVWRIIDSDRYWAYCWDDTRGC